MLDEMLTSILAFHFVVHSRGYSLISYSPPIGCQRPFRDKTVSMWREMRNEVLVTVDLELMMKVAHVQTNSHPYHVPQRAEEPRSVLSSLVHTPVVIQDPSSFDRKSGVRISDQIDAYCLQVRVEDKRNPFEKTHPSVVDV